MRIFLMLLAALLVAGGSGYYLVAGLERAPQPAAAVAEPVEVAPPVQIYVSATALAAGTIIVPDHLARMPLDAEAVTEEMIEANEPGRELLVGSVARQALPGGVPIARSAVIKPGERGFLAAVLPSGKRAISIPLGETSGLSGLVMPGDRVDIILTYSITGSLIDAERDVRASETVLANLRVLALDQRLQEANNARANDPATRVVARTATLEVTPREAEMLTLATQLGSLSMVLNSVEDGGATDLAEAEAALRRAATARPLTLDSQVTTLLHRDPPPEDDALSRPERVSRVQIVRGIESRALDLGTAPLQAGAAGEAPADVARAVADVSAAPN